MEHYTYDSMKLSIRKLTEMKKLKFENWKEIKSEFMLAIYKLQIKLSYLPWRILIARSASWGWEKHTKPNPLFIPFLSVIIFTETTFPHCSKYFFKWSSSTSSLMCFTYKFKPYKTKKNYVSWKRIGK